LKICHDAIEDNVVTYVYAKFGDDRLWNEKALADRKSDNNTNIYKNNVGGHCGPVPGSKTVQWDTQQHLAYTCMVQPPRQENPTKAAPDSTGGRYLWKDIAWSERMRSDKT